MFTLTGRPRRIVATVAAFGAALQAVYLGWLARVYAADDPMDIELVAFLGFWALGFAFIAWEAFQARRAPIGLPVRVLFTLLTPVVLFLLLAAFGSFNDAIDGWDTALSVAFVVAEASMVPTLPVLALSRGPSPHAGNHDSAQ